MSIEKGVYAASLTPMNNDLSCNEELFASHCQSLIDKGCKGVVLFGSTGEGASFSVEEKKKSISEVIRRGVDPQKLIVGNGSACIADTVNLVRVALDHHCLACLISPPSYYKNISVEGVIAYYREIIKRIVNPSLQVILYHIPQNTGVPITVEAVKTLFSEFPGRVIGFKESEGNPSLIKEILQAVPECKLFVGKEKFLVQAMKDGAWGTICGLANLYPELICQLYEKGIPGELENNWKKLEDRPFIPTAKAILNWKWIRPPLVPLTKEEKEQLLRIIT